MKRISIRHNLLDLPLDRYEPGHFTPERALTVRAVRCISSDILKSTRQWKELK